jgi:hypothetical protein
MWNDPVNHHRPRTSFWREPLLHFVLLGAGLFALHAWLNGQGALGTETIVIDRGQVSHLAAGFTRMRERPPTGPELQGLIDEAIREEVFYREALAQGLDRGDVIVRRRMMQKLEFAAQDIDPIPEPTQVQLQAWLDGHPAGFALPPRYAFRQVYLDPDLHGDAFDADASALLATLRAAGTRVDASGDGDPFLLEHRVNDAPADEVRKRFGKAFADALERMPIDRWQGPVVSGFGAHLILLERRAPGRMPTLAEVRDDVRREWMHAQQEARNARYYADLRKRYDVRVEMPGDEKDTGGAMSVAAGNAQ